MPRTVVNQESEDLVQRCGQFGNWPHFLRQKITSDYCAAYAVGMMLSLNGRPTLKQDAIRLFDASPRTWCPPNHQKVLSVLSRAMWPMSISLNRRSFATSLDFMQYIKRHISGHGPVLATAWCRHCNPKVYAEHAFIVTGVQPTSIQIMDPLGSPPSAELMCNAMITFNTANARILSVDGARWDIDLRRPMSFFVVHATSGKEAS